MTNEIQINPPVATYLNPARLSDGSHSIHDDFYINQGEQTNETYLRVFRSVFEKACQLGHHNRVIGVADEGNDQQGEKAVGQDVTL